MKRGWGLPQVPPTHPRPNPACAAQSCREANAASASRGPPRSDCAQGQVAMCPAPASRSWARSGAHGAGWAKRPSPARGGVIVQLWRPCRRPPPCGARALLRPPIRHSLAAGFPVSWEKLHTVMAEPGKSHKATSPCLFAWGHPGRSAPVQGVGQACRSTGQGGAGRARAPGQDSGRQRGAPSRQGPPAIRVPVATALGLPWTKSQASSD